MLRTVVMLAALAAAPAAQAATVTYGNLASYTAALGPSTISETFTGNTLNGTIIQQIQGSRTFANDRLQGIAGGNTGAQFTTLVFSTMLKAFAVRIQNLSASEGATILLDGVQVATISGGATFFGISSTKAFGSITFADGTLPGVNTQFAIDNVRVSAVPLPAAGFGLLSALGLLAVARKRRRA